MLQALHLTKRYSDKVALHDLNLLIEAGEIFCLLGANGAGKTTTINLFMGFAEPTSGKALINGQEVKTGHPATRKLVAYIPENVMLYPNLTGVENLAYLSGLSGRRYPDGELHRLLDRAGLQADSQDRKVSTYSKGMRQKVGVAIALAKQAKALFLDEPTSGLDPLASNEFSNLIRSLADEGVAILMATHDLFRAKEVGDHIGIMKEGRLIKTMPAHSVSHAELEARYLQAISGQLVEEKL
jgi:ABC-2 type transport system ATP-binding protein